MENFKETVIISLDFDRKIFDLAKMLGGRSFLSRENRMSTEVAKEATLGKSEWFGFY